MLPERRLCQLHPGLPRFVFDFRFADYSVKDTLWGVKFAENALSGMLAPIYSAWHGRLGHAQGEHHFPRVGHPCHELCAHQVKLASGFNGLVAGAGNRNKTANREQSGPSRTPTPRDLSGEC